MYGKSKNRELQDSTILEFTEDRIVKTKEKRDIENKRKIKGKKKEAKSDQK